MDKSGNLYGTAEAGSYGYGTVFKLDTSGNATVVHSFTNVPDGAYPEGKLVIDKAGNVYGTTTQGGSYGYGTVFKVDSSGNETVLHSFSRSINSDGAYPVLSGLIRDKAGNLYGTTIGGGSFDAGTVFKIDPSGNETVLRSFSGTPDVASPESGLVIDKAGNLYGTSSAGGAFGYGTVFKLDSSGNETLLHSFSGGADGAYPEGTGLVLDKAGNLYGTTTFGGSGAGFNGYGTVFKLDTSGNETVLHTFSGGADGAIPFAGLVRDKAGNLYGTAYGGGSSGYGTVFKLIP